MYSDGEQLRAPSSTIMERKREGSMRIYFIPWVDIDVGGGKNKTEGEEY